MRYATSVILLCGILVIVSACAPRQRAEVVERHVLTQRQQDERIGGQFIRIVQPGDTLYSIAFVTGLDVNNIAAWNGIRDTSKLAAGQTIRLTKPPGFRPQKQKQKQKQKPKTKTKVVAKTAKPSASASGTGKKASVKPKPVTIAKSKPKITKNPAKPAAKPVEKPQLGVRKIVRWLWPLRGTLVNRFNLSKGQQGIDIQGQRGQTVKASAGGEVVYAGNSLKGYGNLIIIKHSTDYLSAYANNQTILVAEGQNIAQGQAIAKLGTNQKGKAVSQFQIRKNGNPVDPMGYLR